MSKESKGASTQNTEGKEGLDWWYVCDYCEISLTKEEDGQYFCGVCGYRWKP